MPKVLSSPQYTAAKGYNGFPLRNRIQFTSSVGHLLPVWWHYLQPGDKVNCSSTLKTRTQPLATPAMVQIDEHVEWFFVPLQQLYKLFEQVLYGVDDIHSNMFDNASVQSDYPYTQLNDIVFGIADGLYNPSAEYPEHGDLFGCGYAANAFRLLEMLGYDALPLQQYLINNTWSSESQPDILKVSRSLWSLLAYQRIYYSHYRLSDRENNKPSAYNVDTYYQASHVSNPVFYSMLTIHYRPIQKDFFHGGYVSPLISQQNIGMLPNFNSGYNFDSNFFRNYLGSSQSSTLVDPSGSQSISSPVDIQPRVYSSGSYNQSYNATLSGLRQSFALEKLLEITRRAGKHIDAQTLAHFGVKVPEGIADEAYFIGRHDSQIVIGDVVATAGTESDPLGQLAGKGYNFSKNHDCKFEAKTHGVLMAIYSSEPNLNYSPMNCDKLNTYVSPAQFYKPEFDDLGMEPIFGYQGNEDFSSSNINNQVMDWTYRYWELKLKYNRTTSGFYGSLDMWTIQQNGYTFTVSSGTVYTGLATYLVNPHLLDSIMLVPFSTICPATVTKTEGVSTIKLVETCRSYIYDSDPLLHDLFIDVELASKMSTYGLPSL